MPQPSSPTLPRPHLTRLLDAAVTCPITLVTGGPGAGKTTAVAAWTREGAVPGPVAWVNLDRTLSSPSRVWAAVVAALRSALGTDALGPLEPPAVIGEGFIDSLADRLDGRQVVLVLDDVHELPAETLAGVDQLLRAPPEGLHAVLISRHVPVLSLHRHRLAGRLAEVRSGDLSFTRDEIRQLAAETGAPMDDAESELLHRVTDGWAAAVRLALLMMAGSDDRSRTLASFSGEQPLVAGYLTEEFEAGLSGELLDDLTRTCVTDRICAPLAVCLIGNASAVENLWAQLGTAPLIVELPDTGWFRYHPLLLQKLRARLRRDDPALWRELHRRAGEWYEQQGEWLLALDHAIQSEDAALAISVALRSATVELFAGERTALAGEIVRIPPPGPGYEAEALVLRAVVAACRLDYDSAALLVTQAEPLAADLPGRRRSVLDLNSRLVTALLAGVAGDAERLTRAGVAASALLAGLTPAEAPGWARHRDVPLGLVATGQLWLGRPAVTVSLLHEARDVDPLRRPEVSRRVAGLALEALALAVAGQLTAARQIAEEVIAAASATGAPTAADTAPAWLALAMVAVLREDSHRSHESISACGEALARGHDPFVTVTLALLSSHAYRRRGDALPAKREFAKAQLLLAKYPGLVFPARLYAAMAVAAELRPGMPPELAQRLLADHDRQEASWRSAGAAAGDGFGRPGDSAEVDPLVITRGHLLVGTRRPEQVRDLLGEVLSRQAAVSTPAWVVVALAEDQLRHDALATVAIGRALELGEVEGFKLAFNAPNPRLREILRRYREVVGEHREFVDDILRSVEDGPGTPARHPPTLLEPLTERETAVLAYLPTMRSNAEIADALGISVNTVKQHLKSVHRKLAVSSRRDAVRGARDLGLLPEARR